MQFRVAYSCQLQFCLFKWGFFLLRNLLPLWTEKKLHRTAWSCWLCVGVPPTSSSTRLGTPVSHRHTTTTPAALRPTWSWPESSPHPRQLLKQCIPLWCRTDASGDRDTTGMEDIPTESWRDRRHTAILSQICHQSECQCIESWMSRSTWRRELGRPPSWWGQEKTGRRNWWSRWWSGSSSSTEWRRRRLQTWHWRCPLLPCTWAGSDWVQFPTAGRSGFLKIFRSQTRPATLETRCGRSAQCWSWRLQEGKSRSGDRRWLRRTRKHWPSASTSRGASCRCTEDSWTSRWSAQTNTRSRWAGSWACSSSGSPSLWWWSDWGLTDKSTERAGCAGWPVRCTSGRWVRREQSETAAAAWSWVDAHSEPTEWCHPSVE